MELVIAVFPLNTITMILRHAYGTMGDTSFIPFKNKVIRKLSVRENNHKRAQESN